MYKKIGIISVLLLFALTITTIAALPSAGEKTASASTSQIVNSVPNGDYTISIQNNVATKILYTPVPTQNQPKSAQPTVLYDSQHPTKTNWKKIIQGIILIIQGIME
jgi:hypothetical protein